MREIWERGHAQAGQAICSTEWKSSLAVGASPHPLFSSGVGFLIRKSLGTKKFLVKSKGHEEKQKG